MSQLPERSRVPCPWTPSATSAAGDAAHSHVVQLSGTFRRIAVVVQPRPRTSVRLRLLPTNTSVVGILAAEMQRGEHKRVCVCVSFVLFWGGLFAACIFEGPCRVPPPPVQCGAMLTYPPNGPPMGPLSSTTFGSEAGRQGSIAASATLEGGVKPDPGRNKEGGGGGGG